jgi:threonine/homoserine/homoserine lactone efflux protein
VKYVGAAYLIFLCVRTLASSRDRLQVPELASAGGRRAFLEGMACHRASLAAYRLPRLIRLRITGE